MTRIPRTKSILRNKRAAIKILRKSGFTNPYQKIETLLTQGLIKKSLGLLNLQTMKKIKKLRLQHTPTKAYIKLPEIKIAVKEPMLDTATQMLMT